MNAIIKVAAPDDVWCSFHLLSAATFIQGE
jgi:hypothetical protein